MNKKKLFLLGFTIVLQLAIFLPGNGKLLSSDHQGYSLTYQQTHWPTEYLPGALLLFSIFDQGTQYITNRTSFIITTNILLTLLLICFLQSQKRSMIILFGCMIGPLLYFRFDLFPVALVILSINLRNKYPFSSGFFLGLALITKLYPIIYLPYLLWISRKQEMLRWLLGGVAAFSLVTLTLSDYLQTSFVELITTPLAFQAQKPIHIESLWGTVIYFVQTFRSQPTTVSDYGIWGINPQTQFPFMSLIFFNYFWIIPVGVITLLLIRSKASGPNLTWDHLVLLTITYLLFSKLLANQYFYWFLLLIPFTDIGQHIKVVISCLLLGIVSTLVYPNYYLNLVEIVSQARLSWLSLVLLSRQILLIFIFILYAQKSFEPTSHKPR